MLHPKRVGWGIRRSWAVTAAAVLTVAGLMASATVIAQSPPAGEAQIRKVMVERFPQLPKIDELSKSPIPGLWELRIGTDVFYVDDKGEYLIQGQIIETKTRQNVTEARIQRLTAIDFKDLPLKDAVVWKSGSGARKMAVFADPNCGYCKRFEKDLLQVKDVTVYTFLYPILGQDSNDKSRNIWCSADKTKVWRDWMIDAKTPGKTMGQCDLAAIQRNIELGRRLKVNGTPAIFFEDGVRSPGAMSAEQVEKRLQEVQKKG